MDTIPELTVTRYDSDNPEEHFGPNEFWESSGENGPTFVIEFSVTTQVNQLVISTDNGNKVTVVIGFSTSRNPQVVDTYLFNQNAIEVNSGDKIDVSPPVTGVYYIHIIFHTSEFQTVKVYGCIITGKSTSFVCILIHK